MNKKCLRPKCGRTAKSRGLCNNCYLIVRRLIKNKEVTEKQLLENKKILPKEHGGGRQKSTALWFLEKI